MSVLEVTDNNFAAEVLQSSLPVLVDFWAPWCGPCRMLSPVVESIAQKNIDKLKTAKINTDENQKTSMDYQITGIPCLILFKGGKEINRFVGFRPENLLEADILKSL
ncbi:MAG: thioredoxin [Candidatus Margulisiibacteriota bacterium]